MRNFNFGVITHLVGHLPKKETSLLEIANKIPITNKEAEKIIKTTAGIFGNSNIRIF